MIGNFLSRIKLKLGDLWWYTILLFIAQRFSDAINMFVGLWIVPKYVPMEELGAVLPITGLVSVIGLPLVIISIPFQKFLTVFKDKGEEGKIAALLYHVFWGAGIMAAVSILLAYFVLPVFFECLRIETGSLGFLMVVVAILSAVTVIFNCAIAGLKLYGTTVWMNLAVAPFRLFLMAIFMPFRPLSGYVVGQSAGPTVGILGAVWKLRHYFTSQVPRQSYWHEYGAAIWQYTWPFAIWTLVGTIAGNLDTIVIREHLHEVESAGYYVITRFSDVAAYLSCAFALFLFPMASGTSKNPEEKWKILRQSLLGTFGCGCVVIGLLSWKGYSLLGMLETWQPYQDMSRLMTLTATICVIAGMVNCCSLFEIAQGRFRFMWYAVPVNLMKSLGLYCSAGSEKFDVVATGLGFDSRYCRLTLVLTVFVCAQLLLLAGFAVDMWNTRRKERVAVC